MKKTFHLSAVMLFFLLPSWSLAQSLVPISLEEKINNASHIIEGKVMRQRSFWNNTHTMIYTAHEISVFKSFKGTPAPSTVEVITLGGSIGRKAIQASDLLQLNKNDVGLFFCNAAQSSIQAPHNTCPSFEVYGSQQGFIAYDLKKNTGHTPFETYKNISKELYQNIQMRTGDQPSILNRSFDINRSYNTALAINAPTILSFSPSIVNAGATLDEANNLLTINGTYFGDSTNNASVIFTTANNSTYAVAATNILVRKWTPTSIVVRVPSEAGTGQIKVHTDLGDECITSTPLVVRFSVQTAHFLASPGYDELLGESSLVNGSTGYEIQLSSNTSNGALDFSNLTYRSAFQRALATWRTTAGFRLSEGSLSSQQSVNDDLVNLLVFDNIGTGLPPLPAGVLATTISYYTASDNSAQNILNDITKTGFDIIVRNSNAYSLGSSTFTADACSPLISDVNSYDLETTLLHELGHALNLAHINDPYEGAVDYGFINPDKIMNATLHNSVRRTSLDQSALEGANYCITGGATDFSAYASPVPIKMVALSKSIEALDHCPTSFPSTPTSSGTVVSMNLSYATSNKNEDPSYMQINTNGKGVGITNNAYYPIMTNAGGNLAITISNYNWNTANESTCANYNSSMGAIPTKGTELVIYKTSTCPSAQNYPAPVSYITFNDNGVITNIPNLEPNTKYLLMADGIENSKTSFSLAFTGAALPVKIQTLKGTVVKESNVLTWQLSDVAEFSTVQLERSSSDDPFEKVASWTHGEIKTQGNYADKFYKEGVNYYRLVMINMDGSKEYSTVVRLYNDPKPRITIYPNPANSFMNIAVNGLPTGIYTLILRNTKGQIVKQERYPIDAPTFLLKKITLTALIPGQYFVQIIDPYGVQKIGQSIVIEK